MSKFSSMISLTNIRIVVNDIIVNIMQESRDKIISNKERQELPKEVRSLFRRRFICQIDRRIHKHLFSSWVFFKPC